jgi:F-type H+-transporting ATPase subunit b
MHLTGTAKVIDINGTVIVELAAFLLMLGVLSRWVYPAIVQRIEERHRLIAEHLEAAEDATRKSQASLHEAESTLLGARGQAQNVIDTAITSGERVRQERLQRAESEANRLTTAARHQIELERVLAMRLVREEIPGMVVAATEKVLGPAIDVQTNKQLIDDAISLAAGNDKMAAGPK